MGLRKKHASKESKVTLIQVIGGLQNWSRSSGIEGGIPWQERIGFGATLHWEEKLEGCGKDTLRLQCFGKHRG